MDSEKLDRIELKIKKPENVSAASNRHSPSCSYSKEQIQRNETALCIFIYNYNQTDIYRIKFIKLKYIRDFVKDLQTFGDTTNDTKYMLFGQKQNRRVETNCLVCGSKIKNYEPFLTFETTTITTTHYCGIHKKCLKTFTERITDFTLNNTSIENII